MWDHEAARIAIFSMWNGIEAQAGPGAETGEFTGEGEGPSCRLDYNWKAGRLYVFSIHREETAQNGVWWAASIVDVAAGKESLLGRIRTPGSCQSLEPSSCFFAEYFRAIPLCSSTPSAEVTIHALEATYRTPDGSLGTLALPQRAYLVYPDEYPCESTVVTLGTEHRIVVRTGGNTTRETSASYYLWSM